MPDRQFPIVIAPAGDDVRGKELVFRYVTTGYYDVSCTARPEGWTITLERRPFSEPVERQFTDTLLSDWLEAPQVYAAMVGGAVRGYLELSHEQWNNRMRISNIWVKEGHRRLGVGPALMAKAEESARAAGARSLVLETQSCNEPAIRFYLRQGFALAGLDLTAYSQSDVDRREVRLELARPVSAKVKEEL